MRFLTPRQRPDLRDPAVRAAFAQDAVEVNHRDRADGTMEYVESLTDEMMASLPPYGAEDPQ